MFWMETFYKIMILSPLKEEEKIIFALTGNRVTQTKIIQLEIIGVIFIIRWGKKSIANRENKIYDLIYFFSNFFVKDCFKMGSWWKDRLQSNMQDQYASPICNMQMQ